VKRIDREPGTLLKAILFSGEAVASPAFGAQPATSQTCASSAERNASGLQGVEAGKYVYSVTHLDVSGGDAPALLVRIKEDFNASGDQ
jgi:hypothetical protein